MKKFFNTPKKAVISTICIVSAVLAILAVVSAVVIRGSLISKTEAGNIALLDAGLNESDVSALRIKLDFDDGHFQYEVDFYNDGTEYEYSIQAKDGDIIARDIEDNSYRKNLQSDSVNQAPTATPLPEDEQADNSQDSDNYIGVDHAKEIALNHANLDEADVQFTKAKLENDDGIVEYEIEFYYDRKEYDFAIDATTGDILEYKVD